MPSIHHTYTSMSEIRAEMWDWVLRVFEVSCIISLQSGCEHRYARYPGKLSLNLTENRLKHHFAFYGSIYCIYKCQKLTFAYIRQNLDSQNEFCKISTSRVPIDDTPFTYVHDPVKQDGYCHTGIRYISLPIWIRPDPPGTCCCLFWTIHWRLCSTFPWALNHEFESKPFSSSCKTQSL